MSTDSACDILDYAEDYMNDLVDLYEEFIKKSLFLVSITIGALVVMLMYVLKIFTNRNDNIFNPISAQGFDSESYGTPLAALPATGILGGPPQSLRRLSQKRTQNDVSDELNPAPRGFTRQPTTIPTKGRITEADELFKSLHNNNDVTVNKAPIKSDYKAVQKTEQSSSQDPMTHKKIPKEPITSNDNSKEFQRNTRESRIIYEFESVQSVNDDNKSIVEDKILTPRYHEPQLKIKSSLQSLDARIYKTSNNNGADADKESMNSTHPGNVPGTSVTSQQGQGAIPADGEVNTDPLHSLPSYEEQMLRSMDTHECPYRLKGCCFSRTSIPSCSIRIPTCSRSQSNISLKRSCCSLCCTNNSI